MINSLTAAVVACILVGCASASGGNPTHHDFAKDRTFYIVQRTHDEAHLWVQKALAKRGISATYGDGADVPPGTNVVVKVDCEIKWDMGDYVQKLDVDFEDPSSHRVLASGESYHPSLQREDPVDMASEAIDKAWSPNG